MVFPFSRIDDGERIARFVLFSKWIRSSNLSIRPDAFMPPPNMELSVTRHRGISDNDVWEHGSSVATGAGRTLHGRADLFVLDARNQDIEAIADPIEGNQNHAFLTGWPPDKPNQKIIAQELAASAEYKTFEE